MPGKIRSLSLSVSKSLTLTPKPRTGGNTNIRKSDRSRFLIDFATKVKFKISSSKVFGKIVHNRTATTPHLSGVSPNTLQGTFCSWGAISHRYVLFLPSSDPISLFFKRHCHIFHPEWEAPHSEVEKILFFFARFYYWPKTTPQAFSHTEKGSFEKFCMAGIALYLSTLLASFLGPQNFLFWPAWLVANLKKPHHPVLSFFLFHTFILFCEQSLIVFLKTPYLSRRMRKIHGFSCRSFFFGKTREQKTWGNALYIKLCDDV